MGILEKSREPDYSPVPDERSASSSDQLLYDEDRLAFSRPKASLKRKLAVGLVALFVLLVYSTVIVFLTSKWWRKEQLHGANVVDSMLPLSLSFDFRNGVFVP